MGMVVRTNMGALNAARNLNKNSNKVNDSLEKLSSGFKINKASDDASGLAISEKMKAQIKSLDTASANCEDGISMIQTTEGYLSEVHDMLNRMVELCQKSANGTYENAKSADGTVAADADEGVIYNGTTSTANAGTTNTVNNAGTDRDALQAEMNQLCAEVDRIASTANFNNVKLFNGDLDNTAYNKLAAGDLTAAAATVGAGYQGTGSTAVAANTGTGLTLQIGETSTSGDKLTVNVMRLNTDTLFSNICDYANSDGEKNVCIDVNANNTIKDLTGATVTGYTIDISGQKRASAAGEALRSVINKVSQQRADLGAMQNRLDHTVNNLNTASENITSANSRIRDTDMAKEMTKYTQNNVLSQAAQAMLAQANAKPQQVLQLLQG